MSEKFSYTYSADKNEELRKIREKYEVKTNEENQLLAEIRKLDSKVETPGKIAGIIWGLGFTLIFGGGLSLCLKGNQVWSYVVGSIIGIAGLVGMAFAPKISRIIYEKQKAKYGSKILELTDKAMNGEKVTVNSRVFSQN